jgi:hypothetical protein
MCGFYTVRIANRITVVADGVEAGAYNSRRVKLAC